MLCVHPAAAAQVHLLIARPPPQVPGAATTERAPTASLRYGLAWYSYWNSAQGASIAATYWLEQDESKERLGFNQWGSAGLWS